MPLTDKDIIQCYRIDKLFFIDLTNNLVLLRDVFHIGLVIGLRHSRTSIQQTEDL